MPVTIVLEEDIVPMIDVYARPGTFADPKTLARDLAATLMEVEGVPPIALFRTEHRSLRPRHDSGQRRRRRRPRTGPGAHQRRCPRPGQAAAAVRRLTEVVAAAAADPGLAERTWVLLTETYDGGWGIAGHANTNDELVALARAELAG